MQRYILGRFVQAIICVLIVSAIVFAIVRLTGDPLDVILDPRATGEDRRLAAEHLGLDKPVIIQYGIFVSNLVRGDFGMSFNYRRPALDVVLERVPASLELVTAAMVWSLILGLPVGVYAAVRRGRRFDAIGRGFAILGQAIPAFWLGIMLILFFSVFLGILPVGGRGGPQHLILPAFTLGWAISAGLMRLTRSSMLDVLGTDYMTLARAKGLSPMAVIWKHGFKNAALPVLTYAVLLFVTLLGGAVVTEMVFAWPGVGRLMMSSVLLRDFPTVQAIVIMLSVLYIMANLVVDIVYAYLNPRIRYRK